MISGADIRRYRKAIGYSQIDFAQRLRVSQSGLSQLENGQIAVSNEHSSQLEEHFSGKDLEMTFKAFLKNRLTTRATAQRALAKATGNYLTLTVWRWEDGYDLGQVPLPDQAVNLVTIQATSNTTIAFQLPNETTHWARDEIFVFEECRAVDILDQDVCLLQFKPPRARTLKTVLAIAQHASISGTLPHLVVLSPRCSTLVANDDSIHFLMRAVFRGRRF